MLWLCEIDDFANSFLKEKLLTPVGALHATPLQRKNIIEWVAWDSNPGPIG